jgi:hypothetical protein
LAFLAFLCTGVSAQTDQVELVTAENEMLGAGCNPIGLAVEGPTAPAAPTQEWIDEHMACVGGTVQTAAQCQGALSGDRRFEICLLIVVQGDGIKEVGCEDKFLVSTTSIDGPHPQQTQEAMDFFDETVSGHNLGPAADAVIPCSESPVLRNGTGILAAFDIDRTEEDVVFRSRVGEPPGNLVAFIVTDQRMEVPS